MGTMASVTMMMQWKRYLKCMLAIKSIRVFETEKGIVSLIFMKPPHQDESTLVPHGC
jgi:hypothetical protein